jgi:hypothetical protein
MRNLTTPEQLMDKFFNAFGLGLAALLAASLASQPRTPAPGPVPASQEVVVDPIAAQGNAAVLAIEQDARDAARSARPLAP